MKTIQQIGGEFALIERIKTKTFSKNIIKGIGDDAAVVAWTKNTYLLLTTDMMVQDVHFKRKWCTPRQLGTKLMESNMSDIAAMGGEPNYALLSGCFPKNTDVSYIEEMLDGLRDSARKWGVEIVGGDTTRGEKLVLSLTLTGNVKKKHLCLRSSAKSGDILCVTGSLGKSQAGLRLLQSRKKGAAIRWYQEPRCRLDASRFLREAATAMIDISDGLASEIKHICKESSVGAVVEKKLIPISKATRHAALVLGEDPVNYALFGGEDYELLFTIPAKEIARLKKRFTDFSVIGRITHEKNIYLRQKRGKVPLGHGFDHFS